MISTGLKKCTTMRNNLRSFYMLLIILFFQSCNNNDGNKEISQQNWEPLFNGKDLTGWDIKIKDHPLNENYKNTFRIEDSMIRVVYNDYEKFNSQFGHLYTQKPYSWYKLRLQY